MVMEDEQLTLLQLQEMIGGAVKEALPDLYWVSGEVSQISINSSGHCYIELVQTDVSSGRVLAKAHAIIWRGRAEALLAYFRESAGSNPQKGMKMLLNVAVEYSAAWGLSLIVYDLDPRFTLGDIEKERQKTIRKLEEQGMFELNSSLELPMLPFRIAVVSAEGAAGYGDFLKHIRQSRWAGSIACTLFAAPMQGEACAAGIIDALSQVEEDEYDIAVIIRGGGSDMDLKPYDDYELALNVAQFPLPVFTGIGHDRDYHVIDMVAHSWFKTPTAVADFLIGMFENQWERLAELGARVSEAIAGRVNAETVELSALEKRIQYAVSAMLASRENALKLVESKLENVNPARIIGKGFAMILDKDGRRISSPQGLPAEGTITIVMEKTMLEYKVERIASREFGE